MKNFFKVTQSKTIIFGVLALYVLVGSVFSNANSFFSPGSEPLPLHVSIFAWPLTLLTGLVSNGETPEIITFLFILFGFVLEILYLYSIACILLILKKIVPSWLVFIVLIILLGTFALFNL